MKMENVRNNDEIFDSNPEVCPTLLINTQITYI